MLAFLKLASTGCWFRRTPLREHAVFVDFVPSSASVSFGAQARIEVVQLDAD